MIDHFGIKGLMMSAAIVWEPYLSDAPVPTLGSISATEARIGVVFPSDIKPYLLNQSGRTTNPETIAIGKRVAPVGPLVLFIDDQAHPNYSYSLAAALEAMIEWGGNRPNQPIRFLPFADDTENGYFCYDVSVSQTTPPIVYIDTEYAPEDSRSVFSVAPSFTAFLEKLQ
jgi:hypothetical protein